MFSNSVLQVVLNFFVLAFLCFTNFCVDCYFIGDSSSPKLLHLVELVL